MIAHDLRQLRAEHRQATDGDRDIVAYGQRCRRGGFQLDAAFGTVFHALWFQLDDETVQLRTAYLQYASRRRAQA
jgi:hypothetical protein